MQPKRRAIIHIGTAKTGSTSIQEMLAASRAILPPAGFAYLRSPGKRTQTMLPISVGSTRGVGKMLRLGGAGPDERTRTVEEFRAAFAEEMAGLPDSVHTVIFSSEHLSQKVDRPEAAERLKALLQPHFDDFRIVVYLRRQDEYSVSLYSTRLRAGSRGQDLLPVGTARQMERLNWKALLDRWSAAFGRDAVTPRIFARDAFAKGDLIEDFRAVAGLEAVEVVRPPETLNASMDAAAQEFVRRLNGTTGGGAEEEEGGEDDAHEDDGFGDRLPHAIRAILGDRFSGAGRRPSRAEAEAFVGRFAEMNEQVRAEYFPQRTQLFSTDFSRYPEVADPVPDAEAVLKVAMAVVVAQRDAAGGQKIETILRRGLDRLAAGRTAEGVRQLEHVLSVDPTHAGALTALVEAATDEEGRKVAHLRLRRALAAAPKRSDLLELQQRLGDGGEGAGGDGTPDPAEERRQRRRAERRAKAAGGEAKGGDKPPARGDAPARPKLTPEERAARRERRAKRQAAAPAAA